MILYIVLCDIIFHIYIMLNYIKHYFISNRMDLAVCIIVIFEYHYKISFFSAICTYVII